jgi:uncharacterized protein
MPRSKAAIVTSAHHQGYVNPRVLILNVGFLLAQGPGYQRVIELDLPRVRLGDDIELDNLRGELRLSRNSHGVLAQGSLETSAVTECSRCLTPTTIPVELDIEELYSFPPSSHTIYSIDDSGNLDLTPLLREETILATPMNALCQPDCAGLCAQCGQNLNEGPCDCVQDDIDPRLAILRTLNNDLQTRSHIE